MKLRPLDIKRQQFAKAFRGYDADEVDGFLKQVADQWEDLLDELRLTDDRVKDMEGKLKHYERIELALQEALESTKENARRIEETSERKARLVIEEAEFRAQRLLEEAERERFGLRQDLVKLTSRQAEVAARLRSFLFSELEILAQFQGDDPIGFIKLQASGRSEGGHSFPAPPAQIGEGVSEGAPLVDPGPFTADDDWTSAEAIEPAEPAPHDAFAGDAAEAGAHPEQAPAPEPAETFPTPDPWAGLTTTLSTSPEPDPGVEAPQGPAPSLYPRADPWAASSASEPAPAAGPEPTTTFEPEPEPAFEPTTTFEPEPEPAFEPEPDVQPAARSEDAPSPPPSSSPGWSLRSLVTGEGEATTDADRERMRRILDDLD